MDAGRRGGRDRLEAATGLRRPRQLAELEREDEDHQAGLAVTAKHRQAAEQRAHEAAVGERSLGLGIGVRVAWGMDAGDQRRAGRE